jgi:hypothetical protein
MKGAMNSFFIFIRIVLMAAKVIKLFVLPPLHAGSFLPKCGGCLPRYIVPSINNG